MAKEKDWRKEKEKLLAEQADTARETLKKTYSRYTYNSTSLNWGHGLTITSALIHVATLTAAANGVDSPLLQYGGPVLSIFTATGAAGAYFTSRHFGRLDGNAYGLSILIGVMNGFINHTAYQIGNILHDPPPDLQFNQHSPLVEMLSTYAHDGLSKLEKIKAPLQNLYMKSANIAPHIRF